MGAEQCEGEFIHLHTREFLACKWRDPGCCSNRVWRGARAVEEDGVSFVEIGSD